MLCVDEIGELGLELGGVNRKGAGVSLDEQAKGLSTVICMVNSPSIFSSVASFRSTMRASQLSCGVLVRVPELVDAPGFPSNTRSRILDPSSFEIMRPPSEIEGIASASDPHIDEAKSLYLLSVVDITEVDNNRSRHFLL